MQNSITPGLLSLGLLILGAILLLFSGGNLGGTIILLIKNKGIRIFIGSLGVVLIAIGTVGVLREIFPSSTQKELSYSIETPTPTSLMQVTPTVYQQPNEGVSTPPAIPVTGEENLTSTCLSTEYIPPIDGIHPPIGSAICIPSGTIAWISSDPAQINISDIYNKKFTVGFTFILFGPVRFTISDVNSIHVRLDSRTDDSLVGNFDGKSINLVYRNGKVCDYVTYNGSTCP